MNRTEAIKLMKEHIHTKNLQKHSLAVAAIMEKLAQKLNKDEDKWFITGVLHDIDFDYTKDKPEKHGVMAMDILENTEIEDDMKYAIKAHSGNAPLKTALDKALWAADPLSGLIVATALMMPEKKISVIKLKSLKKKFKTKRFAAGANREQIADCQKLDIELSEFLSLGLQAMSNYEKELGF